MEEPERYYLLYQFSNIRLSEVKKILQEIKNITGMEAEILDRNKKPVKK